MYWFCFVLFDLTLNVPIWNITDTLPSVLSSDVRVTPLCVRMIRYNNNNYYYKINLYFRRIIGSAIVKNILNIVFTFLFKKNLFRSS